LADYLITISDIKFSVKPSWLYQDFYDQTHEHNWVINQGNAFNFWGLVTISSIHGGFHINELASQYEESPAFRAWIKSKIQLHEIKQAEFMELASIENESNNPKASELIKEWQTKTVQP
jgi:hypothetical protein